MCYGSKASTGQLDATIVFNVLTKRWSRDDHATSATLTFTTPGTTIDGMDNYAATIDALPNVPVDSPFWSSGGTAPAYFDQGGQLYTLNGTTADSYVVTGDFGDDEELHVLISADNDDQVQDHSRIPVTTNSTSSFDIVL